MRTGLPAGKTARGRETGATPPASFLDRLPGHSRPASWPRSFAELHSVLGVAIGLSLILILILILIALAVVFARRGPSAKLSRAIQTGAVAKRIDDCIPSSELAGVRLHG